MELRLWTALFAACLFLLFLPSVMCLGLRAPVLIGCVFEHRVGVTCRWEPGGNETTNYTLNVQRIFNYLHSDLRTCPTLNTSCSLKIRNFSVNLNFCISVTAHSPKENVTSSQRCQSGIHEVMLHPVELLQLSSVDGEPECLSLSWDQKPVLFLISETQVRDGELKSQIEFRARGRPEATVRTVTVSSYRFPACVFSPDTVYVVRLRHRYQSDTSPWSQWSNDLQGRTAEDAPSSAPMFWRRVIHREKHRLTSLLWKPLPHSLANGRVVSYNVSCQDENAEDLQDKGNCSNLDISHTSCVLNLPLGPCSCSISASTSVGTSPRARIWLGKALGKESPALPGPSLSSVTPVGDRSLEIKWAPASAAAVTLSGFVVEWFVVTQRNSSLLHWEQVNSSTTAMIITEGVEPFQRQAVSVRALYEEEGDAQSETHFVYTRQGAPSAGPQVHVQTSGRTVNLSWTFPVEQRRGFIRSYTLFYGKTNQTAKRVVLNSTDNHHLLSLSPGIFMFWMQGWTDAGAGVMGPSASANIGSEEFSVVLHILLPMALISLLLIIVCVVQNKLVKGKGKKIPDPSQSSVAKWSLKTMTLMKYTSPVIECSEVVLLNQKTKNNVSDLDKLPQTCSYPSSSLFKCETQKQTLNTVSSVFTSCPAIHSSAQVSTAQSSVSSELLHHSYPDVRLCERPPEGDIEPCNADAEAALGSFFKMHHFHSFPPLPLLHSDSQQSTSFYCLPFEEPIFLDFKDLCQGLMQCEPYIQV